MLVAVGDGLDVVRTLANDDLSQTATTADIASLHPHCPFDAVVVDVDNKDPKVGMSCPPREFVEPEYLASLKSILKPNGLLAINVAARSAAIFQEVVHNVVAVFGEQQVSRRACQSFPGC